MVEVTKFDSASFKGQLPMPTSISNWKMYPTVYMNDLGTNVTIDTYECRTSSTIKNNFPENSWMTRTKIPVFIDGRGATQTQANMVGTNSVPLPPFNNAVDWDMDVYLRDIFKAMADGTAIPDSTIRNYKGVGVEGIMADYENIFIMGKNNRYMDTRIELWQPNSTMVLGFSPFSINDSSGMLDTKDYVGASFTSTAKPSLSLEFQL